MSVKPKQNFFPALTGVRALAAIAVFVVHAGYILAANAPAGVQRYFNELSIGLPMFFVLTGFLITIRYYEGFNLSAKWTKKFLISRAARLYPMYFLFTVVSFIYYHFSRNTTLIGDPRHPIFTVFLNLTFLRSFFDDLKFTGVGQGWSITVDVVFYIITPIVFYLIKQKKILIWQPLVIVPIGFLLVLLFSRFNFYGFFGNVVFMLYYTFFGRCIEIFMGIALALYFNKVTVSPNSKKFTYIGFGLMLFCVYLFSIIPLSPNQEFGIKTYTGMILDAVLLAPAIVMFYFGLIRETTVFQKILAGKFFQVLGNAAFMFYLIHLGFINDFLHNSLNKLNDWVFSLYDKFGVDWHSPFEYDQVNVFVIFAMLYGIAILLYKYMEEPLNNRLRNLLFKLFIKPDKAQQPVLIATVEQPVTEVENR